MAAMKTLGAVASGSLTGARLLTRTSTYRLPRRPASSLVVAQQQIQDAIRSKIEEKLPVAVAGVAASSGLAAAGPAQAADVDSAVGALVELVRAGGEAAKAGLDVAQSGVEAAKQAYEHVAPVVKSAVDVAAPVVNDAVKVAAPVVQSGLQQAEKAVGAAITSSGVDTGAVASGTKVVVQTTEQAAEVAKPVLEQVLHVLTTTEPVVLGEWALGLIAAYYLGPPVIKATAGALRGYAGEVSPAAALDALSTDGGAVLLDIRTAREKEAAGLPDLPSNGKSVELEFAAVEDRKLRSQLRNAGELEVKVTALQIAALKRLSKGSSIYLLDARGSTAKAVARELAARGFGRVYVVSGGFASWTNAKLRTRPSSSVSRVEVLSPGSLRFGSAAGNGGSARSVQVLPPVRGSQKALPSGRS